MELVGRKHITVIDSYFIYCYSDAADYEYFIRFDNELTQEIIDEIEKELEYYGCPEDTIDSTDFDKEYGKQMYDYYSSVGYVEVVTDKLDELGIHDDEYDVFVKMEKGE